MMPSRAIFLALAMACVSAPAAMAQAPQCNDFVKIRADADQKAGAIRAATTNHKAEPKELCGLFQRFYAAEGAMLKFLETNKVWCGVPDQAIKQAKLSHDKTLKMRTAICNGGGTLGAEAPRPKPPSLSDALVPSTIDSPDNTKTGRGTFDTLTGSPLAR